MIEPLVSVIIAAYNAENYIEDCVRSIQSQTYNNWEMVICDDASIDSTPDKLRNFALQDHRIKILTNEKNAFASGARNRCIKEAKGEFVMIQDADDVAEPERIEKLVKRQQETGKDIVASAHYLYDDNGRYGAFYPKIEYPTKKSFLYGMPFGHATALLSKRCLDVVGGYNSKVARNEDYFLFMTLYAAGFEATCIKDECLYGYRVDRDTLKRRTFEFRLSEMKIRFLGFKAMGVLFPLGILYCLKPIPAYFVQMLKLKDYENRNS